MRHGLFSFFVLFLLKYKTNSKFVLRIYCTILETRGRRVIDISGSLIWLKKTLMELMFNPCGKFSSPPRCCPWDLFRSFKVCSDAKERVGCGKQREVTASIKSLVKLQPWFLSLRWKTCLRQNCSLGFSACSEGSAFGQKSLMIYIISKRNLRAFWSLFHGNDF